MKAMRHGWPAISVALLLLPSGAEAERFSSSDRAGGELVPSFGTDGIVLQDLLGDDRAAAVAVAPDGELVVVGTAASSAADVGAVIRYQDDGMLDGGFDDDGIQYLFPGAADHLTGVAIDAAGRIVVVGDTRQRSQDLLIARLLPNGELDLSFDGDGILTLDVDSGSDDAAADLALFDDGRIIVVGTTDDDVALVALLENGALDPSFSAAPRALGVGVSTATALALDAAGALVVAGGVSPMPGVERAYHARFDAITGDLDTSIGDGLLLVPDSVTASDVLVATDGGVVVAFTMMSPDAIGFVSDDALVYFNADMAKSVAVAEQADGAIVVLGEASDGLAIQPLLLRYTPAGLSDTTFSFDGLAAIDPTSGPDSTADLAILGDGSYVIVGYGFNAESGTNDMFIAKVTGQTARCRGRLATVNVAYGQVPGPGDDVVVGSSAADTLAGRGGRDTICAGGGDDVMQGNAGDDVLDGGAGGDRLVGGGGRDQLYGRTGADDLDGGRGQDLCRGGRGRDEQRRCP